MKDLKKTIDNIDLYRDVNINYIIGASIFGYLNISTIADILADIIQNLIVIEGIEYTTTYIITEAFRIIILIAGALLINKIVFNSLESIKSLFIAITTAYLMLCFLEKTFYYDYYYESIEESEYTLRKYYNFINLNYHSYRPYLNTLTYLLISITFLRKKTIIQRLSL